MSCKVYCAAPRYTSMCRAAWGSVCCTVSCAVPRCPAFKSNIFASLKGSTTIFLAPIATNVSENDRNFKLIPTLKNLEMDNQSISRETRTRVGTTQLPKWLRFWTRFVMKLMFKFGILFLIPFFWGLKNEKNYN